VRTYFAGRAEVKGFAVADAAIEGKASDALEQLRWAFASGVDPVLVTSAVASGLRGLARYMSAPRGLREADLAARSARRLGSCAGSPGSRGRGARRASPSPSRPQPRPMPT
jgi:hypothetical protein